MVYLKKDEDAAALQALEGAVKAKSDLGRAWWWLAQVRYRGHRNNEALSALREALRINPNDSNSWHALCMVYGRLGDRARIVQALSRLAS
jgi:cytochrome c-type biogenesis protein CcmH/NrfG